MWKGMSKNMLSPYLPWCKQFLLSNCTEENLHDEKIKHAYFTNSWEKYKESKLTCYYNRKTKMKQRTEFTGKKIGGKEI